MHNEPFQIISQKTVVGCPWEECNHFFLSVGENSFRASKKLTETFGLRSTSDFFIPIYLIMVMMNRSSLSLSSVQMFVKWLWAYPTVKSQHMTKCPSPSSRTACLISSLLSNYSYVDYNKRFISFAANEKVDALSQIVNYLNSVAAWCCRFSSDDCKLILKIPIWNMLINFLYCIVLYCIVLYCIV